MAGSSYGVSTGYYRDHDLLPIMGLIGTVAIIVLSISFVVFVALFGRLPIFRKTPIGFLHRLIWIHLPRGLASLDTRLTGGRIQPLLDRTGNYLLYEPHPLVLIFFLLLLSVSETLFIPPAWPILPSPHHYITLPTICTLPYAFIYLSCTRTSPITPTNLALNLSLYPYDYTLFHPHSGTKNHCRTCRLPKPPRSKHCAICKSCIARADHHCIWLNACVSRHNYLHFVLLLLSISVLLAYGAVLGYIILNTSLQARIVPSRLTLGSLTSKKWSTGLSWTAYVDMWAWALRKHTRIGAVTLLAAMSWPLPTGLLVYHTYLVWAGMTTNESAKWADLREDVYDGLVWRAERGKVLGEQDLRREDVKGWPVEGKWVVVRVEERERRPGGEGNGVWERVQNLAELENVYDLGFWENLRDVVRGTKWR